MGYDGLFIKDIDINKIRDLLEKSGKFIIVKSLSQPTMEECDSNKVMVRIEGDEFITHDSETRKFERFLKKNKIKY